MSIPAGIDYAAPIAELPRSRAEWTLEPHRAALLVHDLQRYFVRPFSENCAALRTAIATTAELTRLAREAGVPVFYTAQQGDQDQVERGLQRDLWGPGMSGIPEHTDIIDEVAPGPNDVVLTKHRYSAFARSDLAERLAADGRDQLIITGVYAHIGIAATALEAFQREIHPFVVADGVADFGAEQHRLALAQIAGCCGVVTLASDMTAALTTAGEGTETMTHEADAVIRAGLQEVISSERVDEAFARPDADLFEIGFDSLRAFQLMDALADGGIDIDFGEFVRTPTINWLRSQAGTRAV
ncbi:MAG: isochorismatase family protein [Leucobacter sp.]